MLTLALLAAGCGGGGDKDGGNPSAKNITDPRSVPTAPVPGQIPTPVVAVESAQGQRTTVPDVYVVKSGDTLSSIAAQLNVSAEELTRANTNLDARSLRIGQELRVPRATPTAAPGARATAAATTAPGRSPTAAPSPGATRPAGATATAAASTGGGSTYTVKSGDTACGIAKQLGVSLTALAQANGTSVDGLAALRVGQTLQTPRSTGESAGC